MKKFMLWLVAGVFASGALYAQPRERMTPEQMASRQTEQMVEKLTLTQAQKEQVHQINLKYAKQMGERAQNEDREKRREQMEANRKLRDAEIKPLLTDDQKTAYDKMQKEMRDRGGRGR